ncbi:MAG: hypothetical protein PUC65_02930 [Clostridiales bacterium]|nr:hypothetical protein [Clostridiales bacterium]
MIEMTKSYGKDKSMIRTYRFLKKITQEQAELIIKEMKGLDNVALVDITSDLSLLKVTTKDNEYSDVMWKAVNIVNRLTEGAELKFAGFEYES